MIQLRYLILVLSLLLSLDIPAGDGENIAIDVMAKRFYEIMRYKVDDKTKEQKIAELDEYKQQIEAALKQTPNNPQLWWLKGLNILAYKYAHKRLYYENRELWNQIHKELTYSYHKALDLDKQYEPHLKLAMLNSIRGTGDSESVVSAIKRILDSKEVFLEPSEEIEIRGQMTTHLIRLGRYDEVYENIEYMEKNFPGYANLISSRRRMATEDIEEHKRNQEEKQNTSLSQNKVEKSGKTTVVPTQSMSSKTSKDKTQKVVSSSISEKEEHQEKSSRFELLLLILVMLVLMALFIKSRKMLK